MFKKSVKQESKCLRKHQDSPEHLRAEAARKCTQDVKSALIPQNDSQDWMMNALIYRCLKLVRDGNSFRSSDDFTRLYVCIAGCFLIQNTRTSRAEKQRPFMSQLTKLVPGLHRKKYRSTTISILDYILTSLRTTVKIDWNSG